MTEFTFDAPTVIRTKRDGFRLTDEAIDWVINAYTHGRVADEQMSALLMAIFLRGMDRSEISRWTAAMIASGEKLDFSDLRRDGRPLPTVDKHSTGGVGDKITIPLVAVIAACGAAVPQAAGRGLGHTGGTLDKLESIPGFTAEITKAQVRQQLSEIGAAIFAAGELAPADRKIYALRDVTGTVESLPLIASSVMSKKLAEGADALVLDVKVGRGAFLKTEAESRELAATMVELGLAQGVPTQGAADRYGYPAGPHGRQRHRGRRITRGAGRWRTRGCGGTDGRVGGRDAGSGRHRRPRPGADTARRHRDGPIPCPRCSPGR